MTTFVFTETVPIELISAALGVAKLVGNQGVGEFSSADLGKAVKLSTANNYILTGDNDIIDGFVKAIEPFTVNDGVSFGGVQQEGRVTALVGSGTVVAGDLVVSAAPTALGTEGIARVKAVSMATYVASSGGKVYWRCIRNVTSAAGPGATVGDTVLLERC